MPDAYLCLGSNTDNAEAMLAAGRGRIARLPATRLLAASSIYLTEPQDYPNQPWFQNQAARIATELPPLALMDALLAIEADLGRKRYGPRYGPRRIDIDILLYGDLPSDNPKCLLPHPRLALRAFALAPLLELAPDAMILGQSASGLLAKLKWRREGQKIFQ